MKELIKLGGQITKCNITYYLTEKFIDTNGKVKPPKNNERFCLVNVKTNKINDVCHTFAKGKSIMVWIEPTSIFSIVKPICNVEVAITRNFSIIQWVGFFFVEAYRFIRRITNV